MEYIPDITEKEIAENRTRFLERIEIYKQRGFDHIKSRRFILDTAGRLNGRILEVGIVDCQKRGEG